HRTWRAAPDQHRRRLSGLWRADRRLRIAAGARDRASTARRGRRAPGAESMPGRIHAGLRRARRQRLHRADRLIRLTASLTHSHFTMLPASIGSATPVMYLE